MTDNQRERIKDMRVKGIGYSTIANELGLTKDSVKAYCRTHNLGGMVAQVKVADLYTEGCLCCGKIIVQDPARKKKKFCSDKCRMLWWNSHPELVTRKKMTHLKCPICGEGFDSKNPLQKYCSRKCYGIARKESGNV